MNDQLLATFIALVNFDQKIRNLQDERDLSIKLRLSINEQTDLLNGQLKAFKNELHDLKKKLMKRTCNEGS